MTHCVVNTWIAAKRWKTLVCKSDSVSAQLWLVDRSTFAGEWHDVTRHLQAIFIISTVNFETGIFRRTRRITSRFKDNLDLDLPFGKFVDNFVAKPKLTVRFSKAVFILDPVPFEGERERRGTPLNHRPSSSVRGLITKDLDRANAGYINVMQSI